MLFDSSGFPAAEFVTSLKKKKKSKPLSSLAAQLYSWTWFASRVFVKLRNTFCTDLRVSQARADKSNISPRGWVGGGGVGVSGGGGGS